MADDRQDFIDAIRKGTGADRRGQAELARWVRSHRGQSWLTAQADKQVARIAAVRSEERATIKGELQAEANRVRATVPVVGELAASTIEGVIATIATAQAVGEVDEVPVPVEVGPVVVPAETPAVIDKTTLKPIKER